MSVAFDSLDWQPLSPNHLQRREIHHPLMTAQLSSTATIEAWALDVDYERFRPYDAEKSKIQLVLHQEGQLPVGLTSLSDHQALETLSHYIDPTTLPAELYGFQVIPNSHTSRADELLLEWRLEQPYARASELKLTAQEIRDVLLPHLPQYLAPDWEKEAQHIEQFGDQPRREPGPRLSDVITVRIAKDLEAHRGRPLHTEPEHTVSKGISPARAKGINPTPLTSTHNEHQTTTPTTEHSPIRSVAASLNPPNPQAINSATVSAASAVTVTSPMAHQQVASRTR